MSDILQVRDRVETLLAAATPYVYPTVAFAKFEWLGPIDETQHRLPREFEVRPGAVFSMGNGSESCAHAVIQELQIIVHYPLTEGAVETETQSWRQSIGMAAADSAQIIDLLVNPPTHWGAIAHDVSVTSSQMPDRDTRTLVVNALAHYTLS